MELTDLCLAFFRIGVVSFGGGWTIVGIIKNEVVGAGWLPEAAFANIVALAQITPGPVALNTATLVGFLRFGLGGATLATLSVVAFPVLSITIAAFLSSRLRFDSLRMSFALRVATLAMIVMTLANLTVSPNVGPLTILIAVLAFFISTRMKVDPLLLILASGCIGAIVRILF